MNRLDPILGRVCEDVQWDTQIHGLNQRSHMLKGHCAELQAPSAKPIGAVSTLLLKLLLGAGMGDGNSGLVHQTDTFWQSREIDAGPPGK